jgi:hypothetical protein
MCTVLAADDETSAGAVIATVRPDYTRLRPLPRAVVSASGTPRPPRLRRLTLQHSV